MFAASDYSKTRKSGECGCSSAPPVSKNNARHNPVWRALVMRAGEAPVKDEEPRKMTEEEKREDEYHRQHQCLNEPDPSKPQRKSFTQRETGRAMFGMQNARAITSKAYSNLARRDPYHLRKAEKTFGKAVSFETLDSHVLRIKTKLEGLSLNQNVLAATCDVKECNDGDHNFVAVTTDDLNHILLCPFFFMQKGGAAATTFIHEAGHMANIDVHWEPGKEKYCRGDDVIDCGNICPLTGEDLLENVDAWMRLIYCLASS